MFCFCSGLSFSLGQFYFINRVLFRLLGICELLCQSVSEQCSVFLDCRLAFFFFRSMLFDKDVQLVVRYCHIEAPYWMSFIHYYASIGVKKIHVCVQRRSELEELESFDYPLSIELKLHLLPDGLEPNDALRCLNIREIAADAEYLATLDCDEYYYAYDRSIKVSDVLSRYDVYGFQWILRPVVAPGDEKMPGFLSKAKKQLALSRDVVKINPHRFDFSADRIMSLRFGKGIGCGIGIVHYWARSFEDALLKTLCCAHSDTKTADQAEALSLIASGRLPARLRMLAYMCNIESYFDLSLSSALSIDKSLEGKILRRFMSEALVRKAFENFQVYRQYLLDINFQAPSLLSCSVLDAIPLLPEAALPSNTTIF